ncbi:MAG: hypothetical protein JWM35_2082 [Verrucomicrobia bacterium]|nr:hypothetical protein [Verrucomicrobiota bacterium]
MRAIGRPRVCRTGKGSREGRDSIARNLAITEPIRAVLEYFWRACRRGETWKNAQRPTFNAGCWTPENQKAFETRSPPWPVLGSGRGDSSRSQSPSAGRSSDRGRGGAGIPGISIATFLGAESFVFALSRFRDHPTSALEVKHSALSVPPSSFPLSTPPQSCLTTHRHAGL